jgi:pyoverdine/dityrosine biosynthesis protein Dit1
MFKLSPSTLTTITISGVMCLTLPAIAAESLHSDSIQQLHLQNPTVSLEAFQFASQIYTVMRPYLLDFDIDTCMVGIDCKKKGISNENAQKFILKLALLIQGHQTLEFNLLAFPFKSGNKDRNVIGSLPDMAERKSLEYLNFLISKIKKIYVNSTLTIYTDGLLFNDLFEIPDQTVLAYEASLKKLAADFPDLKIILFGDLLDKKGLHVQNLRNEIDLKSKQIPPKTQETMRKRIANEINHSQHSFLKLSPHAQEKSLDQLCTLVLGRDQGVKDFIEQFQGKNSIRLSIHYQKDFARKVGIKLSDHSVVTPPNGVLVQEKDGTSLIKFKSQVDPKLYQLVTHSINGIPAPFYKWR